jgi:GNAT superfamily N-acetyltransferase
MIYRTASAADASTVAVSHAENWGRGAYRGPFWDDALVEALAEERRQAWTERLSSPAANQYAVIAEAGGAVVGFACTYGADHEHWGSLLDNLHVHPDWQGKGLGKALFLKSVEWCAREYPEAGMYLLVLAGNTRARRLYERYGAIDAAAESWEPPGGGRLASRIYAWTAEQVRELAAQGTTGDGTSRRPACHGRG